LESTNAKGLIRITDREAIIGIETGIVNGGMQMTKEVAGECDCYVLVIFSLKNQN